MRDQCPTAYVSIWLTYVPQTHLQAPGGHAAGRLQVVWSSRLLLSRWPLIEHGCKGCVGVAASCGVAQCVAPMLHSCILTNDELTKEGHHADDQKCSAFGMLWLQKRSYAQ